jgi:hypothetical protein
VGQAGGFNNGEIDNTDDDDSVWVPLHMHLSQSEYLDEIVNNLESDDGEVWGVRDATVRLEVIEGQPTLVVELKAKIETGMVAAKRSKSNTTTQVEFFIRTNPS